MLVPRTEHQGSRSALDCKVFGESWPCVAAKTELVEQYQQLPHTLTAYLGSCMLEAIDGWAAGSGGSTTNRYQRFLGWANAAGLAV